MLTGNDGVRKTRPASYKRGRVGRHKKMSLEWRVRPSMHTACGSLLLLTWPETGQPTQRARPRLHCWKSLSGRKGAPTDQLRGTLVQLEIC